MTKSKPHAGRRVIWAVDPFEERGETRAHVLSALEELSSRGVLIEPVYVLSPDEYDLDVEFNATWLNQIRTTTQKVLAQYLADVKIDGILNPHVLIEKHHSLTRAVRALVAHAELSKADTILVGTHAKSGVTRFFLGSFAETLLLHSKMPVLVVGPHSEIPIQGSKINRILFSTNFGASSFPTFKKVIDLAEARQAKITLFHCLPHPVEPFFQSGMYLLGGGYLSFPDFLAQDEENKRRTAQRYISAAKEHGIEVEIAFDAGRGSTAPAIVERAQKDGSSLIAMAAESSAVSAALVGSVTRQVVRSAPCPVWVLRTP